MKYNSNVTNYDTVHILPEKALIYPKLQQLSPFFYAFFPFRYIKTDSPGCRFLDNRLLDACLAGRQVRILILDSRPRTACWRLEFRLKTQD